MNSNEVQVYYLEIKFNSNSLCSTDNSTLLGIIVFVVDLIKRTGKIVAMTMIEIISKVIITDVIIYRREYL